MSSENDLNIGKSVTILLDYLKKENYTDLIDSIICRDDFCRLGNDVDIIEYTANTASMARFLSDYDRKVHVMSSNKESEDFILSLIEREEAKNIIPLIFEESVETNSGNFPLGPKGGWGFVILNDIVPYFKSDKDFASCLNIIFSTLFPGGLLLIGTSKFEDKKTKQVEYKGSLITSRNDQLRIREIKRMTTCRGELNSKYEETLVSYGVGDIIAGLKNNNFSILEIGLLCGDRMFVLAQKP